MKRRIRLAFPLSEANFASYVEWMKQHKEMIRKLLDRHSLKKFNNLITNFIPTFLQAQILVNRMEFEIEVLNFFKLCLLKVYKYKFNSKSVIYFTLYLFSIAMSIVSVAKAITPPELEDCVAQAMNLLTIICSFTFIEYTNSMNLGKYFQFST